MEQLSLFDFPDASTRLMAPSDTASQDKWDAWWLELLRRPLDDWEDRDEPEPSGRHGAASKQATLPGLI
jgi:hypothetical protein